MRDVLKIGISDNGSEALLYDADPVNIPRPSKIDGTPVWRDDRGLLYQVDDTIGPYYVTECCEAAITYSGDGVLCCKLCWEEQDPILNFDPKADPSFGHYDYDPDAGQRLSRRVWVSASA